MKGLYKNQ